MAQDIHVYSGYKGTPNHVHVEFKDMAGQRFDPFTNQKADNVYLKNMAKSGTPQQ